MGSESEFDQNRRSLLIEDVKCIYTFQYYITTLRSGLLAACLAVIGGIISFTASVNNDPLKLATVELTIMGIAVATTLMMGALNRAQYVFGAYVDAVQQKLGQAGFWAVWGEYTRAHGDRDSISHAHAIAVRVVGYFAACYVVGWNVYSLLYLPLTLPFQVILILTLLFAVVVAIGNEVYVRRQVDTKGFQERLFKHIQEAFDKLHRDNSPAQATGETLNAGKS